VPFDVAVPTEENFCAPIIITGGTFAYVSTLLITVGLPNNPEMLG